MISKNKLLFTGCGLILMMSGIAGAEIKDSYEKGKKYIENKQYEQAEQVFNKIITDDFKDTYALVLRAGVLKKQNRYSEALKDLSLAIELNPNYNFAYLERAQLYMKLGEREEALLDYGFVIEKDYQNIGALLGRGRVYFSEGQYRLAMADANKVIDIDKNHAQAYVARGGTHSAMGNITRAMDDYKKAIEINPAYSHAYFCRGVDRTDCGQLNEAIEDFNKSIKINSNYPELTVFRGAAYLAKGDFEQAIHDCSRSIVKGTKESMAYLIRGQAYQAKGEYIKAKYDYEKLGEIECDFSKNYIRRGLAALYMNRLKDADMALDSALKSNPNDGPAILYKGWILANSGEARLANMYFEKAMAKLPQGYMAKLLNIKNKLLNNQQFSDEMDSLSGITNQVLEVKIMKVVHAAKKNDFKKAETLIGELIKISKKNGKLFFLAGVIKEKMNNKIESEKYYKQAVQILRINNIEINEYADFFPEIYIYAGLKAEINNKPEAAEKYFNLYKEKSHVYDVISRMFIEGR